MKTIDLGNGAACIIDNNGDKYWVLGDYPHRIDGPAIEYADGHKSWYINGEKYSEEEFNMIQEVLWAV